MARSDLYEALIGEPAARQIAMEVVAAADDASAQFLTNLVDAAIDRLQAIPGGEEKLRKMLRHKHDMAIIPVERTRKAQTKATRDLPGQW